MTRAKMVAFLAIFAVLGSACGIGDDGDFIRTGGGAATEESGDSSTGDNETGSAEYCQTLLNVIGDTSNQLEELGASATSAPDAQAEELRLLMQPIDQSNEDAAALHNAHCGSGGTGDGTTSTTEAPAAPECNPRGVVREILLAQGFMEGQFAFEGNFDMALLASASTNGPNSFTTPKLERGDYVAWVNSDEANAVKARAEFGFDSLSDADKELFRSGAGWVGVQALVESLGTANYTIGGDGNPEVTQTQTWKAGDMTWFFVNSDCASHSMMVRAGCGNPQGAPPKPKNPTPPEHPVTPPPVEPPPVEPPPVEPPPEMGKWCRNVGGNWTKIREVVAKQPGDLWIGHENCNNDAGANQPNQPNPQDPLINPEAEEEATRVDPDPEPPLPPINPPTWADPDGDGEITEDDLPAIEPPLNDQPDRTPGTGPVAPDPGQA